MILTEEQVIIFISALLAGLTFVGIAKPILNRSHKRDRYKNLIQDRRKTLYKEAVESTKKSKKNNKAANLKDSLSNFYKAEQLIGNAGANIRRKLNNAGFRSPTAPITYTILKITLPLVFLILAFLYTRTVDDMDILIQMSIVFAAALAGFYAPEIYIKNTIQKRQEEINITFPDALDMILVCVQGGISIEQAIDRISEEIAMQSQILAEELALLSAEMGLLNDKKQAFTDFAERVGGGSAKAFGTAMIQSEKYGTSVSQAIRVMADELRDARMAAAEQKAAALPPKLTVPMILFFLPPLFVIILGPAFIKVDNLE